MNLNYCILVKYIYYIFEYIWYFDFVIGYYKDIFILCGCFDLDEWSVSDEWGYVDSCWFDW